jgi:hypothetical protein
MSSFLRWYNVRLPLKGMIPIYKDVAGEVRDQDPRLPRCTDTHVQMEATTKVYRPTAEKRDTGHPCVAKVVLAHSQVHQV